jgi:Protein of unknown function (DUF3631)
MSVEALDEAPADAQSIDRYIAQWQGRIAAAATDGGGLDTFCRALAAIKQDVPQDRGLLDHAKAEIWDAAVRHLGEMVGLDVLASIYISAMSEPPPDTNEKLDQAALLDEERRTAAAEIERLKKLSPIDYDRERESAANRLGCRVGTLDQQVKAARAEAGDTKSQGRPLDLPEIELWSDAVEGAELLDAVAIAIKRFVVLGDAAADAVALWCVATHTFLLFDIFPRLTVRSATPRCGKTTLRDLVASLVSKPLSADNIMAAALFRTVEIARPTLLLDEADTYLGNNEDLRGIINSGHRRDGCVIRCVGEDHEPRQFSTWSPVLLAQIGKPPPTIYDRSIVICLERKKVGEPVEHFRGQARQGLTALARQAARWARDSATKLAQAEPAPLDYLDDRANDNWHSLLAVADAAGGHWPQRARDAARALAESVGHDAASTVEILLADIRWVFDGRPEQHDGKTVTECAPVDRMSSVELADQLAKIEGRPWAEWKGNKPISQNALARLLKPFKVRPGTIRLDGGQTPKGYKRADFEDVFERYGVPQAATPPQPNNDGHFGGYQTATGDGDVAVQKPQKPSIHGQCGGVAVDGADLPAEEASWTV